MKKYTRLRLARQGLHVDGKTVKESLNMQSRSSITYLGLFGKELATLAPFESIPSKVHTTYRMRTRQHESANLRTWRANGLSKKNVWDQIKNLKKGRHISALKRDGWNTRPGQQRPQQLITSSKENPENNKYS